MHELLMSFGKMLESTWWGRGVRMTLWGYPFVQLIHYSGLALWLGTNIALDLRLMGAGKGRQTARELRDALFAWNWIAFCIVVFGGILLLSGTATAYLSNPAFEVKLGVFAPLALIWHIFVQQKARSWGETMDTPLVAKFAGALEMLLWICVVTAAVEIPNY